MTARLSLVGPYRPRRRPPRLETVVLFAMGLLVVAAGVALVMG